MRMGKNGRAQWRWRGMYGKKDIQANQLLSGYSYKIYKITSEGQTTLYSVILSEVSIYPRGRFLYLSW